MKHFKSTICLFSIKFKQHIKLFNLYDENIIFFLLFILIEILYNFEKYTAKLFF